MQVSAEASGQEPTLNVDLTGLCTSKHSRLNVLDKHTEDRSQDGASTCVCHL
jgi:hypothetical protein